MRVVKFPWVKHTEGPRLFEIYSVSVSPDGSRLATGGLDGKVKIWSVDTLYNYKDSIDDHNTTNNIEKLREKEKEEKIDKNECRPLCSMSRHAGAITCVRFCPNGRFLASGSDDKLVLIWEKDEEKTRIMSMHRNELANLGDSSLMFGDDDSGVNDSDLEHWTVRKRLVAHDNDVQDMAWAPDGSILVTVGLDRSIVVWNGMTFEKIKKFDIHQSHVKGVVFDPAGKYFATCSDDRTMRIFRYRRGGNVDNGDMEFIVEKIIRDPFAKSPLTTYFRRCSWSPDGLYISAPNGTNEGVNANVVIKRGSWESELSLIGHRLPCEVCSFSPRLYDVEFNNNANKNSSRSETVLITAGQDRTLTLWSSSCSTPLCVATEISAKSITDIAWNPNGLNVFLCGLDGVLLSVFFDEVELGHVVPWEENNRALIRYGKDRDMFFPESIEQLKLEEFAEKRGIIGKSGGNIQADRIKSLMSGGESDLQNSEGNGITKDTKPVMNVLVPRSKKHPNKKMPVPTILTTTLAKPATSNQAPQVTVVSSKNQKVTITKSGKKRVAPTLISVSSSSTSSNSTTLPVFTSTNGTDSGLNINLKKSLASQKNAKLNKIMSIPHPTLPKHGLLTLVTSIRSNLAIDESELDNLDNAIDYIAETADNSHNNNQSHNRHGKNSTNAKNKGFHSSNNNGGYSGSNGISTGIKRNWAYSANSAVNGLSKRRKTVYPDWIKDAVVSPLTIYWDRNMAFSNVLIEESKNKNQIVEVRYKTENNFRYSEQNNNDLNSTNNNWEEFDSVSHLVAKSSEISSAAKQEWELFINEKITCISDSSMDGLMYWCLGTESGRILIISKTGSQLCGSIELGSNIVHMICSGSYVMCVCANSLVHSWKFEKCNNLQISGRSIVDGASLGTIANMQSSHDPIKRKIETESQIENIYMRRNGCPIVVVRNSNIDVPKKVVYSYDTDLDCWVELLDNWYIDILTNDEIEADINTLVGNDHILKLIVRRLINDKRSNSKDNLHAEIDSAKSNHKIGDEIHPVVYKSWKSINKCVSKCISI